MNVLLVDSTREIGGAQRSLLELAVALQAGGTSVHAAVPSGPLAEALRAAGVPVRTLPALRMSRRMHPRALAEALRFVRAILSLSRTVRAVRPDVLHANGLTPALLAVQARQGCPVVWHVRDLSMRVSLVRYLVSRVDCIVGISESVADHLTEVVSSRWLRKVCLVCNGIDVAHYQPGDRAAARRAYGLPADAPLVGMIAHLVPWKRHANFLEIAAAIRAQRPDARFVMVGRDLFQDHPKLCRRLEAQIADAGLGDAIFPIRNLDDVAPLLPALDVLVHPAAVEPFGRVICEAMAAGVPVVAANSAGPSCIVAHGKTGLLATPGETAEFARLALQLLAQPETAQRLAAAARTQVSERFNVTRTASEMAARYSAILQERAREKRRREAEAVRVRDDDDE
jgi:glycosyltransferase involved in cell wall biosynthesis